jgi:hypothetical protein
MVSKIDDIYDTYECYVLIDSSKNAKLFWYLKKYSRHEILGAFVHRRYIDVFKSWRKEKKKWFAFLLLSIRTSPS